MVARPLLVDLQFAGFDRAVHPELIETLQQQTFTRDHFWLRVHLTPAGHALEWQQHGQRLTELLTIQAEPLPEHGQLFVQRLGKERTERHTPAPWLTYLTCFQLERLAPEIFFDLHDELCADGKQTGVFYELRPADRLGLSPISYLDLQVRPHSLSIHTYHTFPEEFAVVKIQSLIETQAINK